MDDLLDRTEAEINHGVEVLVLPEHTLVDWDVCQKLKLQIGSPAFLGFVRRLFDVASDEVITAIGVGNEFLTVCVHKAKK